MTYQEAFLKLVAQLQLEHDAAQAAYATARDAWLGDDYARMADEPRVAYYEANARLGSAVVALRMAGNIAANVTEGSR